MYMYIQLIFRPESNQFLNQSMIEGIEGRCCFGETGASMTFLSWGLHSTLYMKSLHRHCDVRSCDNDLQSVVSSLRKENDKLQEAVKDKTEKIKMLEAEKEQLVEEKELLDMEKRQQKRKEKILEETNKRMKRPTAKPSNFPFTVSKLISNYETECGDHLNKYLRKSSIKKK